MTNIVTLKQRAEAVVPRDKISGLKVDYFKRVDYRGYWEREVAPNKKLVGQLIDQNIHCIEMSAGMSVARFFKEDTEAFDAIHRIMMECFAARELRAPLSRFPNHAKGYVLWHDGYVGSMARQVVHYPELSN